jgi:hypothetical protein
MFATVAAIFLENNLIFIFELVFARNIISMAANSADETEFDSDVFQFVMSNLFFRLLRSFVSKILNLAT